MKEITWINWLKVLCMLFVYFYHVEEYMHADDLGLTHIYGSFFINAFFFASGYLLFAKQLDIEACLQKTNEFIKRGGTGFKALSGVVNKLVLPTIFVTIVNYIPKKILRGEYIDLYSFFHDTILGGSTWFTAALAVGELIILVLLLSRIKNIWFYFASSVCLTLGAVYLSRCGVTVLGSPILPWYYKGGMACTLILVGGGIYWKYENIISRIYKGKMWLLLSSVLFFIAFKSYPNASQDVRMAHLNISGVFIIFSSVLLVVEICKLLPKVDVIDYIGRRSLGLYFLSGAIPNIFAVLAAKLGIELNFGLYVLFSVLSFGLACIVASLLYMYMPFVFDFSKYKIKKKSHGSN